MIVWQIFFLPCERGNAAQISDFSWPPLRFSRWTQHSLSSVDAVWTVQGSLHAFHPQQVSVSGRVACGIQEHWTFSGTQKPTQEQRQCTKASRLWTRSNSSGQFGPFSSAPVQRAGCLQQQFRFGRISHRRSTCHDAEKPTQKSGSISRVDGGRRLSSSGQFVHSAPHQSKACRLGVLPGSCVQRHDFHRRRPNSGRAPRVLNSRCARHGHFPTVLSTVHAQCVKALAVVWGTVRRSMRSGCGLGHCTTQMFVFCGFFKHCRPQMASKPVRLSDLFRADARGQSPEKGKTLRNGKVLGRT